MHAGVYIANVVAKNPCPIYFMTFKCYHCLGLIVYAMEVQVS